MRGRFWSGSTSDCREKTCKESWPLWRVIITVKRARGPQEIWVELPQGSEDCRAWAITRTHGNSVLRFSARWLCEKDFFVYQGPNLLNNIRIKVESHRPGWFASDSPGEYLKTA